MNHAIRRSLLRREVPRGGLFASSPRAVIAKMYAIVTKAQEWRSLPPSQPDIAYSSPRSAPMHQLAALLRHPCHPDLSHKDSFIYKVLR